MTGFDDLIAAALPYLATENIFATAGTTWRWDYELQDQVGDPVDIATGFTLTASIRDQGGTELVAPAVTSPSLGVLRCTVTAADSAAVDPGSYFHEVTIVRTSDSAKIIAVGAGDSQFLVKKKVS